MQNRTSKRHGRRFHLIAGLWASLVSIPVTAAAVDARVYDATVPSGSPLYSYSLNKSREGSVEQWNARIVDAEKKEYATETTWLKDGKLVRYWLDQTQVGEQAEVKMTPTGVMFRYLKEGKWKENWEDTKETVITGPQLVDTVLQNWDYIVGGKTFRVRFAVPDRLETFGFRFQVAKQSAEKTEVVFTPSAFFIRQIVSPVVLVFETKTKQILSLSGPTFLKKKLEGKWHDLHAEVRFN